MSNIGGVTLKCLTFTTDEGQRGSDLSGMVNFLGRQVGSGSFSLRYISNGNGEICVSLLFRIIKKEQRTTKNDVQQVLQGLRNYLQTQHKDYEFTPIPDIQSVLRPFDIRDMAEITRGVTKTTVAKWAPKCGRGLGFVRDTVAELHAPTMEDGQTIEYVIPWIRPVSSLRGLCETLSGQKSACLVDFSIIPLNATDAAYALDDLQQNIFVCDHLLQEEQSQNNGTIPTPETKVLRDWICKQKSLLDMPGNLYGVRILVASEKKVSPDLIQAVGEAVTAPPKSLVNYSPLVSGGFSVSEVPASNYTGNIYELKPDRTLDYSPKRLFDGGSAGLAMVLPVADGLIFPGIAVRAARFMEAPLKLPEVGILFGDASRLTNKVPLRLMQSDMRYGVYICGEPGTGKTTVNETAIMSIIKSGGGVAVLDPHGDLVDSLIAQIPENRRKDVILFDVGDTSYPIGLNILEWETEAELVFVKSEMLSYFNMLYLRIEQGPVFWSFIRNSLELITSNKKDPGTLLNIPMLVDDNYRQRWLAHIRDPRIRFYWERTFPDMIASKDFGYISYLTSKLEAFTSDALMRNIIGQKRSTIRFEDIINNRKIFLARMAKGIVAQQNSALLCMIIVARLWAAATKRISVPLNERKDFYIFVDEFQNVATDTFASALSESRKFRLNFVLSNQFTKQLPEHVLDSVLGNVGTVMAFRSGPDDAQRLSGYFQPSIGALSLSTQPNYHAYVRLMVNETVTPPFSMWTRLEPPPPKDQQASARQFILSNTRKIYARPVAEVEEDIAGLTGSNPRGWKF